MATPAQVCEIIINAYTLALLGSPDIPKNALIGISATIARHQTLDRLLTIAWSRQCDLGPIITLERNRIERTYKQQGVQ
ncbi:hypothetical protein GCM10019059_36690 [Camelimonas fluminis]|uniref:Uncharacterized protein n=1 Tax=Camelimonas fluminis TaxID=1576911 RepID=A0ABV7UHX5_9HYPH|nr:hypothetical protein [Camelimonas fluminis]GHE73829.1 hypothetical protein GCM10019059_36690 [Camelimonas fluminis]